MQKLPTWDGLLAKMIVSIFHWTRRVLAARRKRVLPWAGVPASRLLCTLHEKESANLLCVNARKHGRVSRWSLCPKKANGKQIQRMSTCRMDHLQQVDPTGPETCGL